MCRVRAQERRWKVNPRSVLTDMDTQRDVHGEDSSQLFKNWYLLIFVWQVHNTRATLLAFKVKHMFADERYHMNKGLLVLLT